MADTAAGRDRVLDGLSASIRARSATNGAERAPEDARFYATLFPLQTAFDRLFVSDEDKVRLAEDVLRVKQAGTPLKIFDIGAGSGALAIDLVMACTRLGMSLHEITYEGLEPSAYMRHNFRANYARNIGATPFPIHWMLRKGSIEQVEARRTDYLNAVIPTVVVFSFSLHHCFHASVKRFFRNRTIKQLSHAMLVLEVSTAHSWTKPFYMWADGERPENFHNILDHGIWTSQTLWGEPKMAPEARAPDHECCSLQIRTGTIGPWVGERSKGPGSITSNALRCTMR